MHLTLTINDETTVTAQQFVNVFFDGISAQSLFP